MVVFVTHEMRKLQFNIFDILRIKQDYCLNIKLFKQNKLQLNSKTAFKQVCIYNSESCFISVYIVPHITKKINIYDIIVTKLVKLSFLCNQICFFVTVL